MIFLRSIFCDNIEIEKKIFDVIRYGNSFIYSENIQNATSIKISHPGTSIYRLKEVKPREYELIDTTVYLKKIAKAPIRIDSEVKAYGLEYFVWKFLCYILLLMAFIIFIFNTLLREYESNK